MARGVICSWSLHGWPNMDPDCNSSVLATSQLRSAGTVWRALPERDACAMCRLGVRNGNEHYHRSRASVSAWPCFIRPTGGHLSFCISTSPRRTWTLTEAPPANHLQRGVREQPLRRVASVTGSEDCGGSRPTRLEDGLNSILRNV